MVKNKQKLAEISQNRLKCQAVFSNSSYAGRALSSFSQLHRIIPTS
jgi:regulator of PEP synthase PpsR (kinase-PPPase family)